MSYQDRYDEPPEIEDKENESDDEDFNPATAAADDSPSSSSEDEGAKPKQRKRRRKDEVPDELDSGDEVTIEAGKNRSRKKRKGGKKGKDDVDFSDDEAGEGGLIKTRAQRGAEVQQKKALARTTGATVDVDALWAQMSAAPLRPIRQEIMPLTDTTQAQDVEMLEAPSAAEAETETDLVSIKKTYVFAGQPTTEEKEVPRSLLGQHLSDGWKQVEAAAADTTKAKDKESGAEASDTQPKVRRPLRRPSRFDPNPAGLVRGLLPEHQLTWPRKVTAIATADQENAAATEGAKAARPEKAHKLNVVDKSRMDWTGFVRKEGIAEELDAHGKTKEAYLGRMGFLAGVEARQEQERLRAKAAVS